MTTTVESMQAELAAMRSIQKNLFTNLEKMDAAGKARVLSWAAQLIADAKAAVSK